jgi:hypothetical protein
MGYWLGCQKTVFEGRTNQWVVIRGLTIKERGSNTAKRVTLWSKASAATYRYMSELYKVAHLS